MAEVLQLTRDQLRSITDNEEAIRQIELLFENFSTADTVTLVGLRTDVDANTVTGSTNTASIITLQADKQDILAEGAFVDGDKTKLDGIGAGANVTSVNGYTGVVTLVKGDVGLGNVDNTSDADKPISTATQTALDGKKDDFTENTAFNKDFGSTTGTVCQGDDSRLSDSRTCNNTFDDAATSRTALDVYSTGEVDTALTGKEDAFSKNTAFNKNFGTSSGEVCEGNDARLSDSRTCDNTFDDAATARTNIGLGNVDNTSDADKPVSTAQQTALDGKFDTFTRSTQTPTTGFSITLTQDTSNQWLVLNPSSSLASGTITMVAPGSATDGQEIMISSTKQVTALTVAPNGGTVYGAPSVLAAGVTYRAKYDSSLTSWFFYG